MHALNTSDHLRINFYRTGIPIVTCLVLHEEEEKYGCFFTLG